MTDEKPKLKPRGAPFVARPRILSNAVFKNLCQLAFYDRGHVALSASVAKLVQISPRTIERWLSNDERTNAPQHVIEKVLIHATLKATHAGGFLESIGNSLQT